MLKYLRFISTFLLFFLLLGNTIIFAQKYGVTIAKIGYFNPKDTKGGLIFGGVIGSAVDEAVDVGLGVDIFRATNKEETKIGEIPSGGTIYRLDAESSSTIIPIIAQVNIKLPASYTLFYTFGGGIGYEMLWTKEKEYEKSGL